MLLYHHTLKRRARHLRTNMTESEQRLWERLRRKQLLGVQVYRQKPLGTYIVDFYIPKVRLVVEIDGSQHLESEPASRDGQRNAYLRGQGIGVLRFHTTDVLQRLEAVVEVIFRTMEERLQRRVTGTNPPNPPLPKGGRRVT